MGERAAKTNAVRSLERLNAEFRTHEYEVDQARLDAVSVATALGVDANRLFKTLVTVCPERTHHVFCVPGAISLDLDKAARVVGAKSLSMLPLRELRPLTGYIHGACSPFAMKSALPTIVDESADLFETIFVSGGRRGLQIEIAPAALVELVGAIRADVAS